MKKYSYFLEEYKVIYPNRTFDYIINGNFDRIQVILEQGNFFKKSKPPLIYYYYYYYF